jgi:hypothetical protein
LLGDSLRPQGNVKILAGRQIHAAATAVRVSLLNQLRVGSTSAPQRLEIQMSISPIGIYGPTSTGTGYSQPVTVPADGSDSGVSFGDVLAQQSGPAVSAPKTTSLTNTLGSLNLGATARATQTFYSYEMNNGSVKFQNMTGDSTDTLQAGDQWQLVIRGAPPHTDLKLLLDNRAYPPPFQTVGTTDAQGNLTLTGQVSASQVGTTPYLPYYMAMPNSLGGSWNQPGVQDPNAFAGFHNTLIALVNYDVQPGDPSAVSTGVMTTNVQPAVSAALPVVAATADAAPAPPSDPAPAPAASKSAAFQALETLVQPAVVRVSNATDGSGVYSSPIEWAQQLQEVTQKSDVLPPLNQLFPMVALQQPMSLLDFWNSASSSMNL